MSQSIADLAIVGGRVIALDIPDAGAICPVGTFIGGPVPTNFAAYTAPGAVLDPNRILVASGWNFGAPTARADQQQGSVLSIDPTADKLLIDPWFARADGQVVTLDGRVQMYSAQSPAFLNSINTPAAATANWTAAGNALGISINNAFGRVWFANAPTGPGGAGSNTIVDPTGLPLAGAPCAFAGGVFADNLTNRQPAQVTPGGLTTGAVATALLGMSPDGGGRAVFVVVLADGSLVQVHAGLGVDGLAPAGTIGAVAGPDAPRVGIIWDWATDNLLVTDPVNDAIVVLHIPDVDGVPVFSVESVTRLPVPAGILAAPIDLAPVTRETQHSEYASNTSLAQGSDFYVLNHRNNTLARLRTDGSVVGQRDITLAGPFGINPWHAQGLMVSPDGAHVWVTLSGPVLLLPCPQGALVELPAF